MELAEPAAEAGAGDDGAPGLADEGGVDEARGVVGWEPEQDLLHQLLRQRAWRRRHAASGARGGEGLLLHAVQEAGEGLDISMLVVGPTSVTLYWIDRRPGYQDFNNYPNDAEPNRLQGLCK